MSLPVGEGLLKAASVFFLDDSHIAAVGAHHPSAGAGKRLGIFIPKQTQVYGQLAYPNHTGFFLASD